MSGQCSVCNKPDDVGIPHSSVLAAYSLVSCRECLNHYAEPLWLVEAMIEENGGLENCNDWFKHELLTYKNGEYVTVVNAVTD